MTSLSSQGDARAVIGIVERWSQLGEPTPAARLAQVEAFLSLCMMDRAWTRLKGMPSSSPLRTETQLLTAQMFITRGWPNRARAILDDLVEADVPPAQLDALKSACDAPPSRPPAEPPAATAEPDEQLRAAESYLVTGSYLRAKRQLEQLLRLHPDTSRATDLLWALRGDYEMESSTLMSLVETHAPSRADMAESAGRAIEHAGPTSLRQESLDGGAGSFPSLFHGGAASDGDTQLADCEITQATTLEDIHAALEQEVDDDRDEDTQVLTVIPHGLSSGPDTDFDQVEPPTKPGFQDELEGEDDVVVVMTRQRGQRTPPRTNTPREVAPLPPRPKQVPPDLPALDDSALEALPEIEPLMELTSTDLDPLDDDPLIRKLMLAGVTLAVLGLGLIILAMQTVH